MGRESCKEDAVAESVVSGGAWPGAKGISITTKDVEIERNKTTRKEKRCHIESYGLRKE